MLIDNVNSQHSENLKSHTGHRELGIKEIQTVPLNVRRVCELQSILKTNSTELSPMTMLDTGLIPSTYISFFMHSQYNWHCHSMQTVKYVPTAVFVSHLHCTRVQSSHRPTADKTLWMGGQLRLQWMQALFQTRHSSIQWSTCSNTSISKFLLLHPSVISVQNLQHYTYSSIYNIH